jgi:hypothetical protein
MTSSGEVYLGLYGDDFEPNDVSEFVGLEATKIYRRGERNASVPLPGRSAWKFSLGKIEADVIDVYEMSENLVRRLVPFEPKLSEVVQRLNLNAVLQVVLWIDQDETQSMPAIGFERSVLNFLNLIDATIDVDTYRN